MRRYRSVELAWRSMATSKNLTFGQIALAPFGYCFALISRIRNKAYDLKIFKAQKAPKLAVISIGNLSMGGSGKTPLAILIASRLKGSGAILTRGYLRKSSEPLVIDQSNYQSYSPQETGDEPYLLAKKTRAYVVIDSDRERGLRKAQSMGCNWALIDDGFQRRSTARDLDIVLVGPQGFGNGFCFPAGFLREPPTGIKRADLIVLIGGDKNEFVKYSSAPVIKASWRPIALVSDKERLPLAKGDAAVFCGIGNPELFIETLKSAGLSVKALIAGDHQVPSFEELSAFCKGYTKLLCTEKDYVKLDSRTKEALPIYYVESELQIIEGEEVLQKALSAIMRL